MASNKHVVLPGSKRGKDPTASRVGDVDPNERIVVTVNLSGPKMPDANEYVGRTITPEELANKFGASQEDADKVAKTLKKFGLKVEDVSLATRSMRVSGTNRERRMPETPIVPASSGTAMDKRSRTPSPQHLNALRRLTLLARRHSRIEWFPLLSPTEL